MAYEPFLGEIMEFAGNFSPYNWAPCQGQLIPINQNTALFSILGTTYGGDGIHNFGLPDLRPFVDGRKVDWSEIGQPRKCIALVGVFPSRN